MKHILIAYSTVDGQTLRIARHLQATLEAGGASVSLLEINEALQADLSAFDTIVIGASIRYGRYREAVHDFITTRLSAHPALKTAFFSVNLVARKPERAEPGTNQYVGKILTATNWTPDRVRVFAGRLDYPSYRFFDRTMIRFIMWMTKGPTDLSSQIEYTDWAAVTDFAGEIADLAGR